MDNNNVLDQLEVYLTPKDIQKHLGFGKDKTYELISQSDFPKIQIGREYRIPIEEYKKYLQNKRKRGMFI